MTRKKYLSSSERLRIARIKLMETRGSRCEYIIVENMINESRCTFNDISKLQFCHIKLTKLQGSGRGSWKRYKDIISNSDCYKLFCPKHHEIYDRENNEWKGQKNVKTN